MSGQCPDCGHATLSTFVTVDNHDIRIGSFCPYCHSSYRDLDGEHRAATYHRSLMNRLGHGIRDGLGDIRDRFRRD